LIQYVDPTGGYWRHSEYHIRIKAWVTAILSEQNQEFRINAIAQAFGMGPWLIHQFIFGYSSFGSELQREIAEWTDIHPDLQLNNPEFDSHWLSNIRIE